jgi:tetratricopeptide (TPR) repeat protein
VLASAEVLNREGEVVFQGWETLGQWELDDLKKAESAFAKANEALRNHNSRNRGGPRKTTKKIVSQFQQSVALYDQFVLAHQQSMALSYAMLRQGRAFQLAGQRQKALAVYQEVLDFFPDEVAYAAPARYYRGQTYLENGDTRKAMAELAKMVQDPEYKKHLLGANALNALGSELIKRGEAEKALKYLQQLAMDFRRTNPDQARIAIQRVVQIAVQRKQAPILYQFFIDVSGFDKDRLKEGDLPQDVSGVPGTRQFWQSIYGELDNRLRRGFSAEQVEERRSWSRYWAEQIGKNQPEWDTLHWLQAQMYRAAGESKAQWIERIDKQFTQNGKQKSNNRIITFIGWFIDGGAGAQVQSYYQKLDRNKLAFGDLMNLLRRLVKFDKQIAVSTIEGFPKGKLNDGQLDELMRFMVRDLGMFDRARSLLIDEYDDRPRGTFALLSQSSAIRGQGDRYIELVIQLSDELQATPKYAQQSLMIRGGALQSVKRYEEAITAYQQANDPSTSAYAIAECMLLNGQLSGAIQELASIESLFKNEAPKAAMRQADYYKRAKQRRQEVLALQRVLRKYKGTREASSAHVRLEQLGEMIGATDAGR